jgi:DNA-binding cell septation regulator SpoVG
MEIKANINKLIHRDDTNTKALVSIYIDDAYAIHGIKVMGSSKGDFASMPSVRDGRGEYRKTFHPINEEAGKKLNDIVLAAYRNELAEIQRQKENTAINEYDSPKYQGGDDGAYQGENGTPQSAGDLNGNGEGSEDVSGDEEEPALSM